MKVESVAHLKDRGICVTHSDRIYYKKYPYRVDLGGKPYLYHRHRGKINKDLFQLTSEYRKNKKGTFYLVNVNDAERLVDIGLNHQCNVHVTGPLNYSHVQALEEHRRETQEIRKKRWYSKYNIRIRTNWWIYHRGSAFYKPQRPEWFNEMKEFLEDQFEENEYKIHNASIYIDQRVTNIPSIIYINSDSCEDVLGFLKMQFYVPGDRFSPISEFTRAVIVENDK